VKGQSQPTIDAVNENQPYLRNGMDLRISKLVNGWSTMTRIADVGGGQPESSPSLQLKSLAMAGEYFGGCAA